MTLSVNPTSGYLDAFGGSTLVITTPPPGDYTLLESDSLVLVSGNVTITVPTAVGRPGKFFHLKKIDSGTTTIVAASGAETLDGMTSVPIKVQFTNLMIVSNGVAWFIL